MAGTACEFSDEVNFKTRQYDLLTAWISGKITTGCVLTEISSSGASVFIPVNQTTTSNSFDLIIMSPETKGEVVTTIQAELFWINEVFSSKYKQPGLKFNNLSLMNQRAINLLIEKINTQQYSEIKCNMLAREMPELN